MQQVQHFAFEALHVFQRYVEKVAAAAGRVEYAHVAQVAVEGADLGDGFLVLALAFIGERGNLHFFTFGAQRLDDGGQYQALDIGAGRVVGAELVPLARGSSARSSRVPKMAGST